MSKARPIGNTFIHGTSYKKALIYCRVSSERQKTEGHGLESQEYRCREYAKSKGYEVVEVFKDSYSGGGDFMLRPAMSSLISYVDDRAHESFVVIFDDLSRFARDVNAHFLLRKTFTDRGIKIECPNFTFENTPEGELVETMMAAQHQYHRNNNRRQVVQKQKARLESGYWAFGRKRGYVMERSPLHGNILVPKEPDASILREALQGFSNGRFQTKVDACRFLVEKDFWKKQKPERYIDKFTYILNEPLYAGYVEYPVWGVARRPGHHQGIISLQTFEENQKRLTKGNNGKRVRADVSEDFPLRGLLVCGDGGAKMTAAFSGGRSKRYPYYICPDKNCECKRSSHPAERVHDDFDELLKTQKVKSSTVNLMAVIFDRTWIDELKELKNEEVKIEKITIELEEQLDKLTLNAVEAKSERMKIIYEQKAEECANKIDALKAESPVSLDLDVPYRTALEKVTTLLNSPYKVWHSVGVTERQKLFHFIFLDKLPYSKKAGYRTDNLPSAVRLFEDFVTSNSQDVEMAGIEPASESGTTWCFYSV